MKITKADVGRKVKIRNGYIGKIVGWAGYNDDMHVIATYGPKNESCYLPTGHYWPDKNQSDKDIIGFADDRVSKLAPAHIPFKRGDEVAWTSQASGYSKKKRGVIVEVVKANELPHVKNAPPKIGYMRNHRSYIVKTSDGKLYWPLVKYLKPVKSNGKGSKA